MPYHLLKDIADIFIADPTHMVVGTQPCPHGILEKATRHSRISKVTEKVSHRRYIFLHQSGYNARIKAAAQVCTDRGI